MSLFRRPQPQRERTSEEREHARRQREARRRGEPDPGEPHERGDAAAGELADGPQPAGEAGRAHAEESGADAAAPGEWAPTEESGAEAAGLGEWAPREESGAEAAAPGEWAPVEDSGADAAAPGEWAPTEGSGADAAASGEWAPTEESAADAAAPGEWAPTEESVPDAAPEEWAPVEDSAAEAAQAESVQAGADAAARAEPVPAAEPAAEETEPAAEPTTPNASAADQPPRAFVDEPPGPDGHGDAPEPPPASGDPPLEAAEAERLAAERRARGANAADDIPADESPERTDDWFAGVPTGEASGLEDWTAEHRVVIPLPDAGHHAAGAALAEQPGGSRREQAGDDRRAAAQDDARFGAGEGGPAGSRRRRLADNPPGDPDDDHLTGDIPRTPPPLPARSAARRAPRPPQRRYVEPRRGLPVQPGRKRRHGKRILALLALVLVGAAIWFAFSLFQPFKGDGHGRVAVQIPAGATARDIGDLLADRGIVSSGFFFNLRAAIAGERDDLKAGRFVLAKDMSYGAALDRLKQTPAAPPTTKITIPEGRSRTETAPLVKQAGLKGSYLKASKHVKGFSPTQYGAPKGTSSLEGFLYPATYELRKGQGTAKQLVKEQIAAFERNFGRLDLKRARRLNLTPYDVLIIASMIEREAAVPKDRPLISAVIYNRLHDGMALGIDATLRYALDQWTQPLHESELANPTPYNTRLHTGLPPTPIGNPGLASLQAAAKPAHVPYLYYVVKPGTKQHAFSSTDAQFQRDVQRYNEARAANGGKSPTK